MKWWTCYRKNCPSHKTINSTVANFRAHTVENIGLCLISYLIIETGFEMNVEQGAIMGGVNTHIYPTAFTKETRIFKITKTIRDAHIFDKILLLGTEQAGLPVREDLDDVRSIVRTRRRLGNISSGTFVKTLMTLEWTVRVLFSARGLDIVCVNCHSLPVLPLCVLIKWLKKAKLVYDTHELETETNQAHGIRKRALKFLERTLLPCCDEIVCVNDFIADWYKKEYALPRVVVVRNVPYVFTGKLPADDYFRKKFSIPAEHIIFLYLGAISPGRGITTLLNIFSRVGPEKHIVFFGFGTRIDEVKAHSRAHANIHFHPAVKPDEIVHYISQADAGIHLMENTCLNHYYGSPTKFWDYLNAELPVVVSDFPEMNRDVNRFQCGWLCQPTEEAAGEIIKKISRQDLEEKKKGARVAKQNFGWHQEEPALLSVYQHLGLLQATDRENREKVAAEGPAKHDKTVS